ncbi:MAG: signal peptidase II [Thermodesulfobacteriota bacterium]
MNIKKFGLFVLSFLVVFILDMITKAYIVSHFPLYSSRPVISGFFNLVHIQNKGVAFGILGGSAPAWRDILLLLFPVAAMVGILIFTFGYSQQKAGILLALGGILGGAQGNLVDRMRFGGVVDFLDFFIGTYHWPAFNVADSAISLGVIYLLFRYATLKES